MRQAPANESLMRMVRKLTAEEKAALDALDGNPDLTDPDAPEVASWEHALRGGLEVSGLKKIAAFGGTPSRARGNRFSIRSKEVKT